MYLLFAPYLAQKEREKQVVRGQAGSEVTATCYGEYFPNPGSLATSAEPWSEQAQLKLDALVSEPTACLAEIVGTLFLALVVFAVTDDRNSAAPAGRMAPAFIGLTIALLISVIAPLTQACFNPARDFGPRLFTFFAGWGSIAIPGPRGLGFLTVYIFSPIAGRSSGVHLYDLVLRPSAANSAPQEA